MILSHLLHDKIVWQLVQKPGVGIDELYQQLNDEKGSIKISLSQFYKVIKELVTDCILTKDRSRLYINSLRLKEIESFMKVANVVNKAGSIDIPKNEGDKQIYFSDNLKNLDIMRLEVFAQMIGQSDENTYYFYDSRPYHILGNNSTEESFYEFLGKRKNKTIQVFGNNTFLDLYGASLTKLTQRNVRIIDDNSFPKEGYSIGIVGDYVIEIVYPHEIVGYFKQFFETVKNEEDFNIELFQSIFLLKVKCRFTVLKDRVYAGKLKNQIQELYNLGEIV